MSITPQYLDELRARISVAEVIGRRVEWDKRKSNPSKGDYWACCPFHGEKTPSFHVEDRKGFFYCFGCHEKGSAIDFAMKMDNLSFPEAVEMLAGIAGMQPPERDPRAAEKREQRDGLVAVMEAAQRFYRMQFDSAAAREAREYLEQRGLTRKTLETFGIGFAPRGPNALGEQLMQSGAKRDDLMQAGLVGERDVLMISTTSSMFCTAMRRPSMTWCSSSASARASKNRVRRRDHVDAVVAVRLEQALERFIVRGRPLSIARLMMLNVALQRTQLEQLIDRDRLRRRHHA